MIKRQDIVYECLQNSDNLLKQYKAMKQRHKEADEKIESEKAKELAKLLAFVPPPNTPSPLPKNFFRLEDNPELSGLSGFTLNSLDVFDADDNFSGKVEGLSICTIPGVQTQNVFERQIYKPFDEAQKSNSHYNKLNMTSNGKSMVTTEFVKGVEFDSVGNKISSEKEKTVRRRRTYACDDTFPVTKKHRPSPEIEGLTTEEYMDLLYTKKRVQFVLPETIERV